MPNFSMNDPVGIANNMILAYKAAGVESYPTARAIEVLDELDFNDRNKVIAQALFFEWLDQNGDK